jgi:hypothetical protein
MKWGSVLATDLRDERLEQMMARSLRRWSRNVRRFRRGRKRKVKR